MNKILLYRIIVLYFLENFINGGVVVLGSIKKAVIILEVLSKKKDGCGIIHLSKELGMPPSTVHYILQEMIRLDLVTQNNSGGNKQYYIGSKLLSLGSSYLHHNNITNLAGPHIARVSAAVQETVFLAMLSNDNIICTSVEMGCNKGLPFYIEVGRVMPLNGSTSAWAIMAYLPPEKVLRMIEQHDFPKFIYGLPRNKAELLDVIKKTQKRSYAIGFGPLDEDVMCVGMPICDYTGYAVASINVLGARKRLADPEKQRLTIKVLQKESMDFSQRLGYIKKTPVEVSP